MIAALLGLLVPTALLYATLAPWSDPERTPGHRLLYVALAMGLAAGITSSLWFLWFTAFDTPGPLYFAIETALLAVAAVWRRRSTRSGVQRSPVRSSDGSEPSGAVAATPVRYALAVVILLAVSGLVAFVGNTMRQPHGSWDAVAIWNLHAHFLTAGEERWRELIGESQWCAYHGDYPMLLPACVARLWYLAGGASAKVSALVALWFTAATVLLCAATVGRVRGRNQGLLAAVALLGTSLFVRQSSDQYADVPLAWFMLAATAAIVLYNETGRTSPAWLVVGGAAAGLAAWTKNEGILFVAVIVVVHGVMSSRRLGPRAAARATAPFAAGLLPILLLLVYFKSTFAPENDLVAGQDLDATLARLFDASRYVAIFGGLTVALLRTIKGLLFVLPAYYYLMGSTSMPRALDAARFGIVVFGLMLIGYVGVYLTTPFAVDWHLHTSSRRLLLHLWPGTLTAFFLAVAAPEERLSESR